MNKEFSEESQSQELEKTEFNMSLAVLYRIDKVLTACAEASVQHNLIAWFEWLRTLLREEKYMLNDSDLEKNNEFLQKINPLIIEYQKYLRIKKIDVFKSYGTLYSLLEEYETFLRKCLYDRGMLITQRTDQDMF